MPQESGFLLALGEGVAAVAEEVRSELKRDIARLDNRLSRLEAIHGPELAEAHDFVLDRIIHEASVGEWRPWEWADELGISEIELRRLLQRRLGR